MGAPATGFARCVSLDGLMLALSVPAVTVSGESTVPSSICLPSPLAYHSFE